MYIFKLVYVGDFVDRGEMSGEKSGGGVRLPRLLSNGVLGPDSAFIVYAL